MPPLETLIGTAAAFCTTISYVPQLSDGVIIVANAVSLALLGGIIFFKLRERH